MGSRERWVIAALALRSAGQKRPLQSDRAVPDQRAAAPSNTPPATNIYRNYYGPNVGGVPRFRRSYPVRHYYRILCVTIEGEGYTCSFGFL
jgi:hypothetical protein